MVFKKHPSLTLYLKVNDWMLSFKLGTRQEGPLLFNSVPEIPARPISRENGTKGKRINERSEAILAGNDLIKRKHQETHTQTISIHKWVQQGCRISEQSESEIKKTILHIILSKTEKIKNTFNESTRRVYEEHKTLEI